MSEQINTTPVFEDVIREKLTGETQQNALDFVAYLRESGFTNDDEYSNNFYFMGDPTCVLLCFENDSYPSGLWGIYNYPIEENDRFPLDEDLQEFARANIRICRGECGCSDWPRGGNKTVYGKQFKSVCSSVIVFQNPDAESLRKIKRMFENWKLIIAESKSM